ncbi:Imm44 family immunity protein [Pelistega sp. MC2]|uniref:Imm44 family immunity protein n=1 Tax=Pelistega sp. MC2 TaxID=1720297 RepID=UPI0008DA3F1B|nr:Imm44 family immunity protein [Pelistega sp. MC2]
MRLWTSAEAEHTVGQEYSKIVRGIEKIVNSYIEDKQFSDAYKDWRWAYIAMLEGPIMKTMDLPEIVRRSIKRKVLEFRLKIDYQSFLDGDYNQRLKLIIDSLNRCLEHPKMKKTWKVAEGDIVVLKEALQEAEKQMRKN